MRVLSFFSGKGAFEKALSRVNIDYELVNFCEVNKYPATAYCAIHDEPMEKNLWDITDVNPQELEKDIDLLTHGSPCTDFSIAGKQEGGDEGTGTRSSLMWHTVNIIEEVKPKYVIWENVTNVLSGEHKHNFDKYRKKLRKLGYNNYQDVMNAKFWGVPQNRERLFVVSIREDVDDNTFKFPISSLEEQMSLFNQNVVEVEPKVLADVLQDEVREKYYLNNQYLEELNQEKYDYKNKDSILRDHEEWRVKEEYISNCIDAHYSSCPDNHGARTCVLELNQLGGIEDGKAKLEKGSYSQGNRIYSVAGMSCTLSSNGGGRGAKTGLYLVHDGENTKAIVPEATKKGYDITEAGDSINIQYLGSKTRRGRVGKKVANTLQTSCNQATIQSLRIRKLTPLECFRLMDFDDGDYYKAKEALEEKFYNGRDDSDSRMYQMAGNSIVVRCLEEIFKQLFK